MRLTLVRHAYLDGCTLGRLTLPEGRVLATIERPWLPNPLGKGGTLSKSCVPDGLYTVRPHDGKFKGVYAIYNPDCGVWYQETPPECGPPENRRWGRNAILIHSGNFVRDVIGCIAVGIAHAHLNGESAVIESQAAMSYLRSALGRVDKHELLISPTPGTVQPK